MIWAAIDLARDWWCLAAGVGLVGMAAVGWACEAAGRRDRRREEGE